MISFKPGVNLKGLQPQMLIALQVVEEEFKAYGIDTVITSVNDGEHKENSYHYQGRAFDFRTKHAAGIAPGIVKNIQKRLAFLGFDVIFEGAGTPNEHGHLELDKRAGY